MIPFSEYINIKNNYCFSYFGNSKEYLLEIEYVANFLNKQFIGINVSILCKDQDFSLFLNEENKIKLSEFKNYNHVYDIAYNGKNHPIDILLKESKIKIPKKNKEIQSNKKCTILTKGNYPVCNLEQNEIEYIRKNYKNKGFEVFINSNIDDSNLVIGVENYDLILSSMKGKEVKLVPKNGYNEFLPQVFNNFDLI